MKPIVGREYECRGYVFRVHFVTDREVFVARRKTRDRRMGCGIRVSRSVWNKQMKDAIEIARPERNHMPRKLTARERQRLISEGLRLAWKRRKAEKARRRGKR